MFQWNSSLVTPLATLVVSVTFAATAQAVLITNLTTNQVVFKDDFEGGVVGSAPTAQIGSWELVGFGAPQGVKVTDAASPGPNQGAKYLNENRMLPPFYPDVQIRANATAVQSTPGDVIRLEFATYQPSTPKFQSNTFIINPAAPVTGREYFVIGVDIDGNPRPVEIGPNVNAELTAAFKLDTWQNWVIDFELGTNKTTWTLDGTTVVTNSPPNGTHVDFNQFVIDMGGDDLIYLDAPNAVPEPASCVALGFGAVGLLAARMRRRY